MTGRPYDALASLRRNLALSFVVGIVLVCMTGRPDDAGASLRRNLALSCSADDKNEPLQQHRHVFLFGNVGIRSMIV